MKYYNKITSFALFSIVLTGLLTGCSGETAEISGTNVVSAKENNMANSSQANDSVDDEVNYYQGDSMLGTIIDSEIQRSIKDFSALDDVKVDIDITALSVTMAFAQVSNMMYPFYQNYIGQTVKIQGEYYQQYVPENNATYHLLLLMDDTNCCQGVIEFILPQGVSYPTHGSEIMIAGEYSLIEDEFGEFPILKVTDYVL